MNSEMQCPCSDDNNASCQNIMTKKEKTQDGYCIRCAELLWSWRQDDTPVAFIDPASRKLK